MYRQNIISILCENVLKKFTEGEGYVPTFPVVCMLHMPPPKRLIPWVSPPRSAPGNRV